MLVRVHVPAVGDLPAQTCWVQRWLARTWENQGCAVTVLSDAMTTEDLVRRLDGSHF